MLGAYDSGMVLLELRCQQWTIVSSGSGEWKIRHLRVSAMAYCVLVLNTEYSPVAPGLTVPPFFVQCRTSSQTLATDRRQGTFSGQFP